MPEDPVIWIVLFAVCGLVIVLALWLGRGLKLSRNKKGFSVEVKEKSTGTRTKPDIAVGQNLEIEESEVGDITGVRQEGVSNRPGSKQRIEVLSGGKLKKAKIGDITGIKQKSKPKED